MELLLAPQVERCKIDLKAEQKLSFDCEATRTKAQCDDTLVVRCLNNLIGNAIKYAGDTAQIDVSLSNKTADKHSYLAVTISDDGPGIPIDKLSDIFDPFTRLDASRDKKLGGYGLGLAIVKESMRMMGGKVIASNRPEGGLAVTLLFRQ